MPTIILLLIICIIIAILVYFININKIGGTYDIIDDKIYIKQLTGKYKNLYFHAVRTKSIKDPIIQFLHSISDEVDKDVSVDIAIRNKIRESVERFFAAYREYGAHMNDSYVCFIAKTKIIHSMYSKEFSNIKLIAGVFGVVGEPFFNIPVMVIMSSITTTDEYINLPIFFLQNISKFNHKYKYLVTFIRGSMRYMLLKTIKPNSGMHLLSKTYYKLHNIRNMILNETIDRQIAHSLIPNVELGLDENSNNNLTKQEVDDHINKFIDKYALNAYQKFLKTLNNGNFLTFINDRKKSINSYKIQTGKDNNEMVERFDNFKYWNYDIYDPLSYNHCTGFYTSTRPIHDIIYDMEMVDKRLFINNWHLRRIHFPLSNLDKNGYGSKSSTDITLKNGSEYDRLLEVKYLKDNYPAVLEYTSNSIILYNPDDTICASYGSDSINSARFDEHTNNVFGRFILTIFEVEKLNKMDIQPFDEKKYSYRMPRDNSAY